ncbi:MAG: DUF2723 domain-containing protein [bacterium]
MLKNRTKKTFLICSLIGVLFLVVYLFSLCPTVYLIDSGELAAVSYTLGIAHPTGYPLYTLISYFFAHLPGEAIFNLNLLSAFITICAAVFLYLLVYDIIKERIAAIIPVIIFSFAPTVWRISVTNEVYPLTALLSIMILFALYKLRNVKHFYLIIYLMGLAFTNHIIVFSLAVPVFVYLILKYRPGFNKVILALIFALFAISMYVYPIARTNGNAALAWGNTNDLQRLFWHITGKQYRIWMFSQSVQELTKNLSSGLTMLLRDFLYVMIIPVLMGFYYLFKKERSRFWLLISIFLINIFYVINYSIPDIQSYYLPAFISLVIFSAYGIKMIKKYMKLYVVLPGALIFILLNYHTCTLRNNTFAMDYSRSHLEQLPKNSLVICAFWDIYSPMIYLKEVNNTYQDLVIIDKELLRRTWYIKYIQTEYPGFYNGVRTAIDDYLEELFKFEYGKSYDPQVIQRKFIYMLEAFMRSRMQQGVYLAMPSPDRDLDQSLPHYLRIPRGLVYEIKKDTAGYMPFDFTKLDINRPEIMNDERLAYSIAVARNMVNKNIQYLTTLGMNESAFQAKAWLGDF